MADNQHMAKRYLMRIGKLDAMIENKMAEIARWKERALSITAQTGGERVQTDGSKQKMADAINRYIDIDAEIDRLIDEKIKIERTIEQLDVDEYNVLHKIYVQGMDVKSAASAMGHSYSWTKRTHKHGLDNLDKIILGENVHESP